MEYAEWEEYLRRAMILGPDIFNILLAIQEAGTDRADERLALLKEAVAAYREAERAGIFNDE